MRINTTTDTINKCLEVIELIDDVLEPDIKEQAPAFFSSVRQSAASVLETVKRLRSASPKQHRAATNWLEAVKKWLPRDSS
jgi:hypothetical protein